MERIKEALEKAKRQRETITKPHVLDYPSGDAGDDVSVGPIEYSKTTRVSVSPAVLNKNHVITDDTPHGFLDSFKILRVQVMQRMQENGWSTLAVTSPGHGEGKTMTAINLGISIAKSVGYTVLLVDANLQAPGVCKTFGLNNRKGLSDYLVDGASIQDVLVNPSGFDEFVILPAGKSLPNSSEMLGSPRMKALVEELKQRYPERIVIFDLPAVLSKADTMAFAPLVDATLIVVEDGVTKDSKLSEAIDNLSTTNIIGTVLNKQYTMSSAN